MGGRQPLEPPRFLRHWYMYACDRQMKNNFKEAEELPCNDIYKALRFVIAIKLRTGGSYTHFLKWACETRLWQGIHVLGRYIRTCDVVLASQLAPA